MPDTLTRLMNWYQAQCDGEWEHNWGVRIDTLDNPGWTIKINLEGTPLQRRLFAKRSRGMEWDAEGDFESGDWWVCDLRENVFDAACGPRHLDYCLRAFLDWAESSSSGT